MPIPLKPGNILRGRYKINKIIGQGGMGSIYLADDIRLEGRLCALKEVEHDRTLPPDLARQAKEQFQREATVLARLDHPNLPKVSDYFSINDRDYLVMDFVPGKDLRTLMLTAKQAGTFLPEKDILVWAEQITNALSYLHTQDPPILHRDIKPSNVKVTPNGLIKLVDFGLVKVLAPGEVTITVLQGQGTALYTPLEQYGGDSGHTDIRSDIYAFAATLYHLVTNQPPPDARDRFLQPDCLTPPRTINSAIHQHIEKAILMGLSLHPDGRPATIQKFWEALQGNLPAPDRTIAERISDDLGKVIKNTPDRYLFWAVISLTLMGFLVSLVR
ncbi:MAG: serine/threonine protein kinase [Anaerolineaceae bacterium]|nr:serine/threonine protein kinase [Anaerolineaceae bacterium]MBN2678284.1 serine/threonine protein kinase [Anaerolineaceae bacterium]